MDGESFKVGISACLLGENVRYDGTHKLDRYLRHTLGQFVRFIPVCPEVECGLPVPREAMRLVGDADRPRLLTVNSKQDLTERMESWGQKRLAELEKEELCGFIFKSKSPSSGLYRVKVYTEDGMPGRTGTGLWARMFTDRFPLLPVEEDGRLHDPVIRESFITRLFAAKRWSELVQSGPSLGRLIEFHTRHKLLLLAHSVPVYRELGKLLAEGKSLPPEELYTVYERRFFQGLSHYPSVKKNVNVLYHILGHFKKQITADEKQETVEILQQYASELIPLVVPVTLLNHFVRKYGKEYLAGQYYLKPHPTELRLRNHV